MAEIINLRAVRKARARAADQAQADANRARHGQTLSERNAAKAEVIRIERTLDGARIERTHEEG